MIDSGNIPRSILSHSWRNWYSTTVLMPGNHLLYGGRGGSGAVLD